MDTTPCEFAPIGLCDTPEHQPPTTPVVHRRSGIGPDKANVCGSPESFRQTLTNAGTTCPDCLAIMATPTADNYGLLPIGATLTGIGTITGRTLTAYTVDRLEGAPGSEFVPFTHVHPLATVEPLVVLG
jgi:hypothetical protein